VEPRRAGLQAAAAPVQIDAGQDQAKGLTPSCRCAWFIDETAGARRVELGLARASSGDNPARRSPSRTRTVTLEAGVRRRRWTRGGAGDQSPGGALFENGVEDPALSAASVPVRPGQ
jgi:hypothetical protein